jgi:hypothetical protein
VPRVVIAGEDSAPDLSNDSKEDKGKVINGGVCRAVVGLEQHESPSAKVVDNVKVMAATMEQRNVRYRAFHRKIKT